MTVAPNKEQLPAFKKYDLPITPFPLRLVRVCLSSGLIEVLATNLLDETRYPVADFAELYPGAGALRKRSGISNAGYSWSNSAAKPRWRSGRIPRRHPTAQPRDIGRHGRAGFDPDVIECQLAHAERNKVRAAYHRAEYLEERRRMMQWWADFLEMQQGEVSNR
ncbi:hypothetical protein [Crenobacter oryzisoli]|uniref:hypothetical protein n=1 Tax=Crenobacter oryzisoli TaxID=3056844 RepID=UPI003F495D93